MAGFGDAPMVTKVAVILVGLGFILNIIGFGAPYWSSSDNLIVSSYAGLWQRCSHVKALDTTTCQYFTDLEDALKDTALTDWFEATRTFEAIGFLATLATIVFLILYACVSKTAGNKIVAILLAVCAFGACGTIMIGIITYGANVDVEFLSWAFALSTVGGIFFGISGLLFLISMCSK